MDASWIVYMYCRTCTVSVRLAEHTSICFGCSCNVCAIFLSIFVHVDVHWVRCIKRNTEELYALCALYDVYVMRWRSRFFSATMFISLFLLFSCSAYMYMSYIYVYDTMKTSFIRMGALQSFWHTHTYTHTQ